MGKLVFLPISIGGGLIGKKLFGVIWGLIDDQDPPKPEHRNVHVGKLLIALFHVRGGATANGRGEP